MGVRDDVIECGAPVARPGCDHLVQLTHRLLVPGLTRLVADCGDRSHLGRGG